ncbi:hypothetical protein TWF718_000079 [Orbilia javanica]|uniref:DUF7099 domain-containing protein n=1 Tax=Orbilia javanica TaxID=47235 RepID=A0AAN8MYS8_9PEZI
MSIFTIAGLSSFYNRLDGRTDIDQLCDEAVGKYVLSRSGSEIAGTADSEGPGSFKELLGTVGSVLFFQLVHQFRQSASVKTAFESQDPASIPPRLYSLSPNKVPSTLRYLHQQYRSFYFSIKEIQKILLEILYIGTRLLRLESVQTRQNSRWLQYLADTIDDTANVSSDEPLGVSISFGIKAFLLGRQEQGFPRRTRDLRYCAGVSASFISYPLNPLDFGRIRTVMIEIEQQFKPAATENNYIDYFWSMCDILFIIIAASAELYSSKDLDGYSGELASLANEFQVKITDAVCDKLGYLSSLADEAAQDLESVEALTQRQPLYQTSEILCKRDLLATLNDRSMARILDSVKILRQGSYSLTDRIYVSNCPEGHVLNEIQKEMFLAEYERRAGAKLNISENSTRIAIRTLDAYPCPVCSEISRIEYSQGLGSLTSLTEIPQFTALSRIIQDAKVEVAHAMKEISRYYHTSDQRLEVNFSRNRPTIQIQLNEQENRRQNGGLNFGNMARSRGQSSQSSGSSSRDSAGRSPNTPLPSPNGSSSSNNGLRKLKSSFVLRKLISSPREPEIDLVHLNTDSVLISTHTASGRVFFYGNSSISIYSYAGAVPESRARIELVSDINTTLRLTPASILISPSKQFLAIALNFMRGNSQIQVWSLDEDGYNPNLVWHQVLEGVASGLAVHPDENFVFVITNKRILNIFDLVKGSRVLAYEIPLKIGVPDKVSVVEGDILLFRCLPDVELGRMKIFTLSFGTSGCKMGWDYYIKWQEREQDDNGVSALSLCETKTSGSTLCYSTWTMSGQPAIIRWGIPDLRSTNDRLHDDSLGTRIQDMAISPSADFVALINQRGDIYQYAVSIGSQPKHLKTIQLGNRRRSTHLFHDRVCLKIDEDHNKIIVAYARAGRGYIEKHDIAFSQI